VFIAVIADIHGNLPALEAVVADIEARGITRVVNLGDHLSGPLWPRETAEYLLARDWASIAGNHDRQLAFDDPATHGPADRYAYGRLDRRHLDWLASLPATLSPQDGRVLLCHGIPSDDNRYLLEVVDNGRLQLAGASVIADRLGATTAAVVACGHSHQPRLAQLEDGAAVVNPGSVGLQAYEADGPPPHLSETGAPLTRYAIVDLNGSRAVVSFVAVSYDYERAAGQAERNGRPDWAFGLRTGYVRRR
jgi:predicted phosphodiesterase